MRVRAVALGIAVLGCAPAGAWAQQWYQDTPAWTVSGGEVDGNFGYVGPGGDYTQDGAIDILVGETGFYGDVGRVLLYEGTMTGLPSTASSSEWIGQGGDQMGSEVGSPGDITADGIDDIIFGVQFNDYTAVDTGGTWFVDPDTMQLETPPPRLSSFRDSNEGWDLALGADFNQDGCPDWAVGIPGRQSFGVGYGCGQTWDSDFQFYQSPNIGSDHGRALASGTSMDADPRPDLAVGGATNGLVEVYLNESFGAPGLGGGGTPSFFLTAATLGAGGSGLGTALAMGDYDGDGFGDLAIGAPFYSTAVNSLGAVYVCWGSAGGPSTADCEMVAQGSVALETLGSELVTVSDRDGDGDDELLVGASGWNSEGRVALFAGSDRSTFGGAFAWDVSSGETGDPWFGVRGTLADVGDINGDNLSDLLIGAPHHNDGLSPNAGQVSGYLAVPVNDACANSQVVETGQEILSGTTTAAVDTDAQGAGVCGGNNLTTDFLGVWYSLEGTGATVRVSTCLEVAGPPAFDTQITVYTGGCGALSCVAGNDDFLAYPNLGTCQNNTSLLDFATQLGESYLVFVHGYNAGSGPFELDVFEVADGDGDGWGDDKDCAPNDAAVHPFAAEVCDGADNNCDSNIDEGLLNDSDGDGFTCDDCDDFDANFNPSAAEICDGLDNNCDGQLGADEEDPDGDGIPECDGDCDPSNGNVYPGADEGCDFIDSDCDGSVGFEEVDADNDGYAICEGDCAPFAADRYPTAPEDCDGLDTDCDGNLGPDETDDDGDNWTECAGDCDDGAALVSPDQVESGPALCTNGLDDDCDGDEDSWDSGCLPGDDDDDDATSSDDDDDDDDDDATSSDDDDDATSSDDDDDATSSDDDDDATSSDDDDDDTPVDDDDTSVDDDDDDATSSDDDDDDTPVDDDDTADDDDAAPSGSEEGACEDGVDNDGDGLTDADDPECWSRGVFGCSAAGSSAAPAWAALLLVGLLVRRRRAAWVLAGVLIASNALAAGPPEWKRQLAFAELELREGNFDKARRATDSALLLAPENTDALYLKALALEALGEVQEASAMLEAYFEHVTPLTLHDDVEAARIRIEAAAAQVIEDAEAEAAEAGEAVEGADGSAEGVEEAATEGEASAEETTAEDPAAAAEARAAARTGKARAGDFDPAALTVRLYDAPDFLDVASGAEVAVTPGSHVLRVEGEHGRVDAPVEVSSKSGKRHVAALDPAALAPAALTVAGLPAGGMVVVTQTGPDGLAIEELYATPGRYRDVHPSGIPVVPPQTIGNLVGGQALVTVRHHKYGTTRMPATMTAGGLTRVSFDSYTLPKQPDADTAAATVKAAEQAKLADAAASAAAEAAAADALVGPEPEVEKTPTKSPVVKVLPTIILAGAGALVGGILMGGAAGQSQTAATHRASAEEAARVGNMTQLEEARVAHDAAREAETGMFAGSLVATGAAMAGVVVTVVVGSKKAKPAPVDEVAER